MKTNDSFIEQRVFQKTAELISTRGIKGWNMDQLAEASGLAKNTLYKMIGSKENLLQRVTFEYINNVQSRLSEIIAANNEDYMTSFKKAVSIFPELLNGFYADHLHEIFLEYPIIETRVRSHQDTVTNKIISFIQHGIDVGVLDSTLDPVQVFETLQAIVLFNMKKELSGKEKSTRISTSIQYLIYGIIKKARNPNKERMT